MLLIKLIARYMGSVVVAGREEDEDGRGLYMKAGILVVVADCVVGAGVVGRGLWAYEVELGAFKAGQVQWDRKRGAGAAFDEAGALDDTGEEGAGAAVEDSPGIDEGAGPGKPGPYWRSEFEEETASGAVEDSPGMEDGAGPGNPGPYWRSGVDEERASGAVEDRPGIEDGAGPGNPGPYWRSSVEEGITCETMTWPELFVPIPVSVPNTPVDDVPSIPDERSVVWIVKFLLAETIPVDCEA
jgi:hypothetical protein